MTTVIKTTCLTNNKGKILLIKEWSKKKNGYFWNVVKGTFKSEKDKSLIEAIIREAKEEINLDIIVEYILSIFEIKKEDGFLLQFNFICRPKEGATPSLLKTYEKDEEIIDYKWFTFDEFKLLKESEIMNKRVNIIVNDYFLNSSNFPLLIIKRID